MVYESDFYTTRRPYRSSPAYSTYTVSTAPSRQIRILPSLGKVHVVHTYDRIVPYVGHKKLTVVTVPPRVYSTPSSVLRKQYEWIENRLRPIIAYSPTNRYLNSDSSVRIVYIRNPISGLKYPYKYEYIPSSSYKIYRTVRDLSLYDNYWAYYRPLSLYYNYWPTKYYLNYIYDTPTYLARRYQREFDDETKLIRAQAASLLKQIHLPSPRIRTWFISPLNRFGDVSQLPVRYSNDTYIHRLLTVSPNHKIEYATYYTEPVKKYIGQSRLSCVTYAGGKGYNRRRPLTFYEDALRNDIQLLSYYINKFRDEKVKPKEIQAPLSRLRESRIFSTGKPLQKNPSKTLEDSRPSRLDKIYCSTDDSEQVVKKQISNLDKGKEIEATQVENFKDQIDLKPATEITNIGKTCEEKLNKEVARNEYSKIGSEYDKKAEIESVNEENIDEDSLLQDTPHSQKQDIRQPDEFDIDQNQILDEEDQVLNNKIEEQCLTKEEALPDIENNIEESTLEDKDVLETPLLVSQEPETLCEKEGDLREDDLLGEEEDTLLENDEQTIESPVEPETIQQEIESLEEEVVLEKETDDLIRNEPETIQQEEGIEEEEAVSEKETDDLIRNDEQPSEFLHEDETSYPKGLGPAEEDRLEKESDELVEEEEQSLGETREIEDQQLQEETGLDEGEFFEHEKPDIQDEPEEDFHVDQDRLEEIAHEAQLERENELVRQAEELAQLARAKIEAIQLKDESFVDESAEHFLTSEYENSVDTGVSPETNITINGTQSLLE